MSPYERNFEGREKTVKCCNCGAQAAVKDEYRQPLCEDCYNKFYSEKEEY